LGLAALLLVAYGWFFVYFEKINNPNEMVRVYMARSLAEEHRYALGERKSVWGVSFDDGTVFQEWGYVNDKALVCRERNQTPPQCPGTLYAAKAPGASLLGSPIIVLQRWMTRWFAHRAPSKAEMVFVLRWALGIVPSILLWLGVWTFLLRRGVARQVALIATLAGALGSLSLTYGQMFAGHQLAACALGLAFLSGFYPSGERSGGTRTPLASAISLGLGAGLAICIEYPSAPAAAIIAIGWWRERRPGWRAVLLAALGALPSLALLAHFHWSAFGAPWRTPYSFLENVGFAQDISPGLMGVSPPTFERISGSLWSPTFGLWFWAPWTALALAAPFLLRRAERNRIAGFTAAAVVVYYLFFQITHALWRGGWVIGPRYITALVPFAAISVAFAIDVLKGEAKAIATGIWGAAAAASILATGLASSVSQGFPPEIYNPLPETVGPLLLHGFVPPNLLQLAGVPGLWSAVPYLAALAIGALLSLTAPLRLDAPARGKVVAYVLALFVLPLLAALQWGSKAGDVEEHARGTRYLASVWEPNPPPGARPFESASTSCVLTPP